MIEISHRQARSLIRQGLDDRPLPEEQWSMLQAHLEGCSACRAYRGELAGSQHDLARVLQNRWSAAEIAAHARGMVRQVTAAREKRRMRWRAARWLLAGAAGVLLVIGFSSYMQLAQVRARLAAPTPTARVERVPQATPTPAGPAFRGLLAYTAEQDGSAEIFLLNRSGPADAPTVEITNLTQHPAQDIAPAWSPDGEWIAFLSDRASDGAATSGGAATGDGDGRFELYVMTVAGTRLTRLTARADVQWTGPMSWSASGDTIALIGRRSRATATASASDAAPASSSADSDGDAFIFLVPLAGRDALDSMPRTLGFTRGVEGPLRFSPTAPLLAYIEPPGGSLLVYDQLSSTFSSVRTGAAPPGSPPVAEGDFDWSPDGGQLAYLSPEFSGEAAAGPVEQRLMLSGNLFMGLASAQFAEERMPLASGAPGSMRGVSWMPSRYRRVLAFLQRASYPPDWVRDAVISGSCWTLRLITVNPGGAAAGPAREVEGLCIDSPLGPASWSQEGEWILVSAFRPGEARMGIYAVQMPPDGGSLQAPVFDRLADAPLMQGASVFHAHPPLVRPSAGIAVDGRPINPRPAAADAAGLGGANPPAAPATINGRLLYNVVADEETRAATLRRVDRFAGADAGALNAPDGGMPDGGLPDGARPPSGIPLLQTLGAVTCPSGQPGGGRVAFLSDAPGAARGGPEIFVADEDGGNLLRLTDRSAERRPLNIVWGCPVWSPDGARLALTAQDGIDQHLLILPVDGAEPLRVAVGLLSDNLLPVWNPDGRSVALVTRQTVRGPVRINLIDVTAEQPVSSVLYEARVFDAVVGLTFSPLAGAGHDSPRIAFIGANYSADGRMGLYSMHTNGSGLEMLSELPAMEFQGWVGTPNLSWQPGRGITFAIRHRTDARIKTSLWEYDTTERQRRPLVFIEDMLYASAWSPDGRWLAFSSDGGLFLLDWQAARRGDAVPLLISAERVFEVDWK